MIDPRTLGARISERRQRKGLTQKDLAELLSVCPQAVSKWERGRAFPDLTYIDELAGCLDCSIDELLIGVGQKRKEQVEK